MGIAISDITVFYFFENKKTIVQVLETIDWIAKKAMFLRPALCLMKREGEDIAEKLSIAVNRKYELTSRQALGELGLEGEVKIYNGNMEETVKGGINDLCVEFVYSGKSLEENGLEIVDQPIRLSDFVLIGVNETAPLIFQREYDTISDRLANPREDSYTCFLAENQNNALKKTSEEYAEFVKALVEGDNQRIVEEFQDLLYTLQLNMAMQGINSEQITREMFKRYKR